MRPSPRSLKLLPASPELERGKVARTISARGRSPSVLALQSPIEIAKERGRVRHGHGNGQAHSIHISNPIDRHSDAAGEKRATRRREEGEGTESEESDA